MGSFLSGIRQEALSPEALRVALEDLSCGAVCIFEGRVRDMHEGREVSSLSYDCYVPMAEMELAALLEKARQRWDLGAGVALHRIGNLELGDIAVWIGVASGHRTEAFEACRFLIEEIKLHLPVWKKETYAGIGSQWQEGQPLAGKS
jgi:molybdopterin synthase catalytic subunit